MTDMARAHDRPAISLTLTNSDAKHGLELVLRLVRLDRLHMVGPFVRCILLGAYPGLSMDRWEQVITEWEGKPNEPQYCEACGRTSATGGCVCAKL